MTKFASIKFLFRYRNICIQHKFKCNQLLEQVDGTVSCWIVGTAWFHFDQLLSQRLQFGAEISLVCVQCNFKSKENPDLFYKIFELCWIPESHNLFVSLIKASWWKGLKLYLTWSLTFIPHITAPQSGSQQSTQYHSSFTIQLTAAPHSSSLKFTTLFTTSLPAADSSSQLCDLGEPELLTARRSGTDWRWETAPALGGRHSQLYSGGGSGGAGWSHWL